MDSASQPNSIPPSSDDLKSLLGEMPPELLAAWQASEKQRRGESVDAPAADPALDPVSGEVERRFGGLLGKEARELLQQRMKDISQIPKAEPAAIAEADSCLQSSP